MLKQINILLNSRLLFIATPSCWLAMACSNASDAVAYTEAIQSLVQNPNKTRSICAEIEKSNEKSDCLFWGARQLAHQGNFDDAESICLELNNTSKNECFFVLAEKKDEPKHCQQAESFETDCRIHLLHQRLKDQKGTDWFEIIDSVGLSIDEQAPWMVVYRWYLDKPPLDLNRCMNTPKPELCRQTGQDLFRDKLRMLRDTHGLTCNQDDWPSGYHFVRNEHLDMVYIEMIGDLECSG